ncbi:MAG: hypothetical protein K2X77_24720 [Candidatus Obscuribacterales bacterium]|jgi:hypothetical protein|nr:hypothetical protein [Candidatus Obscuribacterales bacterium]
MKSNRKNSGKAATAADVAAEVEREEPVQGYIVGQDSFETRLYGDVHVDFIAFEGHTGIHEGMILVHRQVPYGMAMTQYRTEIMAAHPVRLPIRLH